MYYDLINESKWTKNTTSNNTDVYIYNGEDNSSGIMVIGEFDFSVEELILIVMSQDAFLKVNPVLEKIYSIEEVSHSDIIFYLKIKKILLIASRDFVGITRRFTRPDGTQSIVVYSVDYSDSPTPNDGTIRAEMIIGGWHFIPLGENKTKAINFSINDYKGNIPKFALNMGASTQATVFKNLRDMMAKQKELGELDGAEEFEKRFGFKLKNGIAEGYPMK